MKTKQQFICEILDEFALKIKSFGYDVYLQNDFNYSYGYVTDGINICYFQINHLTFCLELSTVIIPNKIQGTGFNTFKVSSVDTLEKEHIEKSFYKGTQYKTYDSFEDYKQRYGVSATKI